MTAEVIPVGGAGSDIHAEYGLPTESPGRPQARRCRSLRAVQGDRKIVDIRGNREARGSARVMEGYGRSCDEGSWSPGLEERMDTAAKLHLCLLASAADIRRHFADEAIELKRIVEIFATMPFA